MTSKSHREPVVHPDSACVSPETSGDRAWCRGTKHRTRVVPPQPPLWGQRPAACGVGVTTERRRPGVCFHHVLERRQHALPITLDREGWRRREVERSDRPAFPSSSRSARVATELSVTIDPTAVLGVARDASLAEIRDAYRAQAKRHITPMRGAKIGCFGFCHNRMRSSARPGSTSRRIASRLLRSTRARLLQSRRRPRAGVIRRGRPPIVINRNGRMSPCDRASGKMRTIRASWWTSSAFRYDTRPTTFGSLPSAGVISMCSVAA